MTVNVLIRRINGHTDILPFQSYEQARYFAKHNVSYTGPNVQRVEIVDYDGSTFAVWDRNWNEDSRTSGLEAIR